jgi:hypothetical protein
MEQKTENCPKNKLHADLRSIRKMVKKLLCDYYIVCKTLYDQPMSKPYVIEKLGHKHFDNILDIVNNVDQI